MRKRSEGNGESKVTINYHEKGPDYIIFAPDRIDNLPEQTPIFLSRSVEGWLKENPNVRIRCALPIVENGSTIAIHLWFDRD